MMQAPTGKRYLTQWSFNAASGNAMMQVANGSLIYIRTAFYSTDKNLDAWMKKNKREAGVRRYPGFPSHTAEAGSNHAITASHSLSISSIQQALGIDKRFSQMAGERALTANQQALVKAQFQCRKRHCYDARKWLRVCVTPSMSFNAASGIAMMQVLRTMMNETKSLSSFNAASGIAMMQDCRREATGDGAPGTFLENLGLFFDDSLIFRQNVFTIPGKIRSQAMPFQASACLAKKRKTSTVICGLAASAGGFPFLASLVSL